MWEHPLLWLSFSTLAFCLIFLDLCLMKDHVLSKKEALRRSIFWVLLALAFNGWIWIYFKVVQPLEANKKALEFLTGYLVEKSLSIDNLFVFVAIFAYFKIPKHFQQRVLSYGIFTAILLRGLLIFAGIWALAHVHALFYVFGVLLVLTGLHMLVKINDPAVDLAQNKFVQLIKKFLPFCTQLRGHFFLIKENGKYFGTPLLLAFLLIELSDVLFAFDSVPAILAITQDPLIVFSSNVFAILGLRALYFLLAHLLTRFHSLRYGIALLIVLIGVKMLIKPWFAIPIGWTLLGMLLILLITIFPSLKTKR